MLTLISWLIYSVLVGATAKAIFRGENEPTGFASVLITGFVGSYVGGFILWAVGSTSSIEHSGLIMGIVGGYCALFAYDQYVKNQKKE